MGEKSAMFDLLAAASLSMTLIAGSLPAHAQNAEAPDGAATAPAETSRVTNGTRFGAWTVACEAIAVNETVCVLSQRLVRSSDNAFLAELTAFWNADMTASFIAGRVPNGVYFPSGFAVRPENSEDRHDFIWQSCSRDICEALLAMDAETLEAIDEAGQAIIGYRPSIQAEPHVFRAGTNGILEGLTALKQARR